MSQGPSSFWIFTGEGAPAPSPVNIQRRMIHCLVVFHGGRRRFLRGRSERAERAREGRNGRGDVAGGPTGPGTARSGPGATEIHDFGAPIGPNCPESEPKMRFFTSRPEREPSKGVLPSWTRFTGSFGHILARLRHFPWPFLRFRRPGRATARRNGPRGAPRSVSSRFGAKNGRKWARQNFPFRENHPRGKNVPREISRVYALYPP